MKDFTFLDFVREVGKHITVNYMMAKDSVKRRLNGEARDGLSLPSSLISCFKATIFFICMRQKAVSSKWAVPINGEILLPVRN